jgi:hypothetical protein
VCVATGLALVVVASCANRLMASTPTGGWSMYPPASEPTFSSSHSDSETLRAAAVWLAAIAAWLLTSWWLFRERRS